MNQRIRELADQAHSYADDLCVYEPENSGLFEQKFAELILRECANYIGDKAMLAGGANTIVGEEGLWLSEDLLKHFGVEE